MSNPCKARISDFCRASPFMDLLPMQDLGKFSKSEEVGKMDFDVLQYLVRNHFDPAMYSAAGTFKFLKERPIISHLFPLFKLLAPGLEVEVNYDQDDDTSDGEQDSCPPDFEESSMQKGTIDFVCRSQDALCGLDGKHDLDTWLTNNVWQLGLYGHCLSLENAQAGRFGSVPLVGIALGKYAISQMDCFGTIKVENGEISLASFEEFKAQETSFNMKQRPGYPSADVRLQDLQGKLSSEKSLLSKDLRFFLDGVYPVGKFYIMKDVQFWDSYSFPTRYDEVALCHFYEFLLGVIIGDRVLEWKDVEGVKAMIERNKASSCRFTNVPPAAEYLGPRYLKGMPSGIFQLSDAAGLGFGV